MRLFNLYCPHCDSADGGARKPGEGICVGTRYSDGDHGIMCLNASGTWLNPGGVYHPDGDSLDSEDIEDVQEMSLTKDRAHREARLVCLPLAICRDCGTISSVTRIRIPMQCFHMNLVGGLLWMFASDGGLIGPWDAIAGIVVMAAALFLLERHLAKQYRWVYQTYWHERLVRSCPSCSGMNLTPLTELRGAVALCNRCGHHSLRIEDVTEMLWLFSVTTSTRIVISK